MPAGTPRVALSRVDEHREHGEGEGHGPEGRDQAPRKDRRPRRRVSVHYSLPLALVFFAWLAHTRMRGPVALAGIEGSGPLMGPWAWAAVLAVGLLLVLLVHEAAHVVSARFVGGRVRGLTLMLLGPCAEADGLGRWARAAVALSGPVVTLLGAAVTLILAPWVGARHADVNGALMFLGEVQAIYAALELVPSPPFDGGRILAALFERVLGLSGGNLLGTRIGKGLAVLLAIAGTLATDVLPIALAALLWAGAEQAAEGEQRRDALDGLTVRAVLQRAEGPGRPAAADRRAALCVGGDEPLAAVAERMRSEAAACLVVMERGRVAGVLTAGDVARIGPARREQLKVREAARRVPAIEADRPAAEAGALMRSLSVQAVPVTERGVLVGLLTDTALDDAEGLRLLEPAPAG